VAVTEPLPGFVAAGKIHISPEVTVDPVGAGGTIFVGGGAMEFGRFAGATRILGRMPTGVALVALGIRPPQSLVISGPGHCRGGYRTTECWSRAAPALATEESWSTDGSRVHHACLPDPAG